MIAIIKKTIYLHRKKFIAISAICLLMIWMYVGIYPSIQKEADEMAKLIESYPESFLKAFGVEGTSLFTEFEAFVCVEYYSLMWPLLAIILVLSLGASAIAGEVDDKTMDFLLSQPISRSKIFISKYVAGVLIMLAFVFFSTITIIPIARMYDVEVHLGNYFAIAVISSLFSWAIYNLAFMISSITSSKGIPSSLTAGVVVIMYALNLLAALQESLKNLKYLSFFYYYDYHEALVDNHIDLLSIIVFSVCIVIFTAVGFIKFRKRDIY